MNLGDLVALLYALIEPALQDSELVALLELFDRGFDGAETTDVVEELFDVGFLGFQIDEGSKHLRGGLSVDLEDVDLDVFVEVVLEQVSSQFVYVPMDITEEDEWSRIGNTLFLEEVLDGFWIVAILLLSDDTFKLLDLVAFGSRFDVLVVGLLIVCGVDERPQEEVHALEGTHTLEDLDAGGDGKFLVVLDGHIDNELHVLPVMTQHVLHA